VSVPGPTDRAGAVDAPRADDRAGAVDAPRADDRAGAVNLSGADDRAGAVFGALSDPTRRALLAAIAEHPAATATQLASELPISRQAVLKHLNALTDAGLVDRTRAGREVRYQFTPAPLSDAVGWMAAVGAEWDDRLALLRSQIGDVRFDR
jgi:DNA-binding transcriptional ArsR family regulator